MDEKTEALIGPEPVVDPVAEQALARKVKQENDELRIKIAGGALYVVAAFAALFFFVLAPILASLDRSAHLLLWALVSIPLVAFAVRAWRMSRFPLGRGHAVEGPRARSFAAGIVLLSLITFFWAGLAEVAWNLVAGW